MRILIHDHRKTSMANSSLYLCFIPFVCTIECSGVLRTHALDSSAYGINDADDAE